MIETKEQYEELKGAIAYVAAGHYQDEEIAEWLERQVHTIEALRDVARAGKEMRIWFDADGFANSIPPRVSALRLGNALAALPEWIIELPDGQALSTVVANEGEENIDR